MFSPAILHIRIMLPAVSSRDARFCYRNPHANCKKFTRNSPPVPILAHVLVPPDQHDNATRNSQDSSMFNLHCVRGTNTRRTREMFAIQKIFSDWKASSVTFLTVVQHFECTITHIRMRKPTAAMPEEFSLQAHGSHQHTVVFRPICTTGSRFVYIILPWDVDCGV